MQYKQADGNLTVKDATVAAARRGISSQSSRAQLHHALCEDRWFSSCATEFQDALIAHGRLRQFAPREIIYIRNEQAEAMYCVISGSVRSGITDSDGTSAGLVHLEPYHWFGETSLIDGLPAVADATAEGEVTLFCVSRSGLENWLKRHPQYWQDLARLSVGKLRIAYAVVMEPGPLPRRLARRLLLLTEGFGSRRRQPRLKLRLSQEQLADLLGASRQSINRALRTLETAGAISLHYGMVEVLDIETLRNSATPE